MKIYLRTCAQALLALILVTFTLVTLVACGGPAGGTGNTKLPAGPAHATIDGQIAVPADFLADISLAELMDSGRVWLVDTKGDFLLSGVPDATGAFELEKVPAGVAGQRLLAIFGSGEDAVTLETLLGPLPATSDDVPSVSVNISLASTVQAEVLQDPKLAEQLRSDVLESLSRIDQIRLSSFALEPLELEDGANMITIVSDTSSLGSSSTAGTGLSRQADECAWWNPLSWASCWETPDLQVQSGGRTSDTVRKPPVPQNYTMGLEYQSTTAARIIAAGGGNIIATGGGNIIAAGGGNIIAAGGGNIIATGGGNIIATGGLNSTGLGRLANGVQVVRRVDFGDVLEEGEIGELRRFGPQILSDFVIVPASLFEKYSNEEVAFIAKNISWAGERGREAAERIVADMRARKAAADEIQASFRKAAQLPPIELPADAKKHSAPELIYVKTSAGQAALAAPVIVSARIPADAEGVVEITARNVTASMKAYWRAEEGSFESQDLTPVTPGVYRTPLSQNGYRNLMLAAAGPASPYSNLVRVVVRKGTVTTPGLDVQGFEGIGGQGDTQIDFIVEGASGDLFVANMQKTVLHLAGGDSEWTSVSEGASAISFWEDRNALALGASSDGELYYLLDGQAYRLETGGRWEPYGPALYAADPSACPYGAGGVVDGDGGIYLLASCNDTYDLYHLDPSGSFWTKVATASMSWPGPLQIGGDGNLYFVGRMPSSSSNAAVLKYEPGSSSFTEAFSPTTYGAKAQQLVTDDAGNLILLARPTGSTDPDTFRIYLRGPQESGWTAVEMTAPHVNFRPEQIARPRGDGPIYAISYSDDGFSKSLFSLAPNQTEWAEDREPTFFNANGAGLVTQLWQGRNGSVFALVDGLLYRKETPSSAWQDLSHGLSGPGGEGDFAFTTSEVLFQSGALTFMLSEGSTSWESALLESGANARNVFYDDGDASAYAWSSYPWAVYERVDNGWQQLDLPDWEGVYDITAKDGVLVALVSLGGAQRVQMLSAGGWTTVGEPLSAATMIAISATGDIYVGGYEGVYQLVDGKWSELGSTGFGGAQRQRLVVSADGTLYASWSQNGVWRYPSGGTTWEKVSKDFPTPNGTAHTANDLVVDSQGVLFAATDYGIYRLPADANTWVSVPGLAGVMVKSLAIGPDNRLYANAGKAGVFRSTP